MNHPYDQQAVSAVLRASGKAATAELAKTLHWPRTRVPRSICMPLRHHKLHLTCEPYL